MPTRKEKATQAKRRAEAAAKAKKAQRERKAAMTEPKIKRAK